MSKYTTVVVGLTTTFILSVAGLALAQIFGLTNYPGGQVKAVYSTTQEGVSNPGSFTFEIVPEGEDFRVTSTSESTQTLEDLSSGAFGTFLFGLGFRRNPDQIDLSPLFALDEREVQPKKKLLLPGGANLETQAAAEMAGLPVVRGIYTHPDFPDQRVLLAFSDGATRKLLPFPPLLQLQKRQGAEFVTTTSIELVAFVRP